MPHVVLSHPVSLPTSPGPRNPVPQDTVCAQAHRWYAKPIAGAPAHCRCSDAWPVPKRIASAKRIVRAHSPWSVPRPIVRALAHRPCPAHGRCFGSSSVLRRIVCAQAHCQCQAYCQCSGPWSVSGALLVLRRMVGTPTHGRYSGPLLVRKAHGQRSGSLSVLKAIVRASAHRRCPGPWSVLQRMASARPMVSTQLMVGIPAHGRCSHRKPRTGAPHHLILSPTRACRRRQTSSARSSLRLFAAPDAWRSAPKAQRKNRRTCRRECVHCSCLHSKEQTAMKGNRWQAVRWGTCIALEGGAWRIFA